MSLSRTHSAQDGCPIYLEPAAFARTGGSGVATPWTRLRAGTLIADLLPGGALDAPEFVPAGGVSGTLHNAQTQLPWHYLSTSVLRGLR